MLNFHCVTQAALTEKFLVQLFKYLPRLLFSNQKLIYLSLLPSSMIEIDKLLEQIIERFEESDKETGDKGKQAERSKTEDRKKAEEMRKLSMEKLGETLKRKGEEDGGATPRKRASASETIVYL